MKEITEYTRDDLTQIGAQWMNRIKESEKREERWMKDAEQAENAYLAGQIKDGGDVPDWNILHSNVETIVPAIYNSTPAPDIRPRHGVREAGAKVVADLLERAIALQIDDNQLDTEIEAGAQDAFMAGRGVVRIRFDADVEDVVEEIEDEAGEVSENPLGQRVTNERVIYEVVSWRNYREGPAKRWSEVPWVAFRHFISQAELERIRDDEMWGKQKEDGKPADAEQEEKDVDVWEIWCRSSGRVYFVVEQSNKVVKVEDDPLGLSGFFPMPAPVQPIKATSNRIPVCPYAVYRKQAEELNRVTKRIQAILAGLKVKGGIASGAESIEQIALAGDNELVPIADVEGLAATGGLDKAIVWWPIDKAITVLRELYAARDQIKSAIYEITGISDIIRGQGAASETATAQQIKTEWGSLRVKKMQRLIERQVRDLFKLTAEVISLNFDPQNLARSAGMEITKDLMVYFGKPLDHYRIDVESDSTVRADTSKKREEMARFLEGTAQFFQVMAPLVKETPEAAAPIAEIFGAFTTQFNLGKSAEDAIDQMVEMARQMAQKPRPNPGAEAMKAEMAMKQREQQAKAQVDQGKLQIDAEKVKVDREKLAFEREKFAVEVQLQAGTIKNERLESLATVGGDLAQALAPLAEMIAQGNAEQSAMLSQLIQGIAAQSEQRDANLMAALTAPKRVVKDENGRPVGVETMVN